MKFKLDATQIALFMVSIIILVFGMKLYFHSRLFLPIVFVAIAVSFSRYVIDFFAESKKQSQIEAIFPEFVRDLVSGVKSGMTVPAAIVHISDSDYGALNPYVEKMGNQLTWSIPMHKVLVTFANDTGNRIIKRAIATVIEAEQSGGNIEDVLESITESLVEIKRIKEERKASIHSQTIQSYMIFLIFLGVMVVISNLLIPFMSKAGSGEEGVPSMTQDALTGLTQSVKIDTSNMFAFFGSLGQWFLSLDGIFLMLAMIQGLFAGMVIGKLSEGSLQAGLKHSLVLGTVAFFVITLT
mgnify:CR=1 FL=1